MSIRRSLQRIQQKVSAAQQLGVRQIAWYGIYQSGLRSGLWRALTPAHRQPKQMPASALTVQPLFTLPDADTLQTLLGARMEEVITEANEITSGKARLFGSSPVPLDLTPAPPLAHWSDYETGKARWQAEDIKFIWEGARFGWVYPLGRAYRLTNDERYATAFWQSFEAFQSANPAPMGPNWASAQEVALRLIAFIFAAQVFHASPESTEVRKQALAVSIAEHAARILPTLSYARAQHNNHLLTEALGLWTAGSFLHQHPQSARWRKTGADAFRDGLLRQISPSGVYAQYSLNYHRLMLQAALLAKSFGLPLGAAAESRLAVASRWLIAQVDVRSGAAPNYGSNDGAHILPLASGGFADHRPTAQAAARAFLHTAAYPAGVWDELCLWLGIPTPPTDLTRSTGSCPSVLRLGKEDSWAILHAETYRSRPSHADQLHVDLFWRGQAVTLDAGTYRYTAPAPWQNALASTRVHNTVMVDDADQMQRAGRFLWIDWAQAEVLSISNEKIAAQHHGYERLGILHRRTLTRLGADGWRITDDLTPTLPAARSKLHAFRLHWLLPDLPWSLLPDANPGKFCLQFGSAEEVPSMKLTLNASQPAELTLTRAGISLSGNPSVQPIDGWFSPTYAHKQPALSCALTCTTSQQLQFVTDWKLR